MSGFWGAAVAGLMSVVAPCVWPMVALWCVAWGAMEPRSRRASVIGLAGGMGVIVGILVLGAGLVDSLELFHRVNGTWAHLSLGILDLGVAIFLWRGMGVGTGRAAGKLARLSYELEGRSGHFLGGILGGLGVGVAVVSCAVPVVVMMVSLVGHGGWLVLALGYWTGLVLGFVVSALISPVSRRFLAQGALWKTAAVFEVWAATKEFVQVMLLHGGVAIAAVLPWGLAAGVALLWAYSARGRERMGAYGLAIALACAAGLGSGRDLVAGGSGDTGWIVNNQTQARAVTRSGGAIFVDVSGYTCTNCRWMERHVFADQRVARELSGFTKERIYTDAQGQPYAGQAAWAQEKLGTLALPTYAVLGSGGEVISVKSGRLGVGEMLGFLATSRCALANAHAIARLVC